MNKAEPRAGLRVNLMPSMTAFEPMAWNACANPAAYPTTPLSCEAGEGRVAHQRAEPGSIRGSDFEIAKSGTPDLAGEGKHEADDVASPSPRSTPPGVESSSPVKGRGEGGAYDPFVSHEF